MLLLLLPPWLSLELGLHHCQSFFHELCGFCAKHDSVQFHPLFDRTYSLLPAVLILLQTVDTLPLVLGSFCAVIPCKDWIRFGFRHRLGTCHGCSEEHSVLHQSCSMWKTFSFLSRSIGYQHFSSFFALNGALNANFLCFLKAFHFTTRFHLRPGLRDCASILLFIFVYMPILLTVVLLSGVFQD